MMSCFCLWQKHAKTFQPQSGPPSWHSGHIAARKSGRTLPPVTTFETNPRYKLPKTRTHPLTEVQLQPLDFVVHPKSTHFVTRFRSKTHGCSRRVYFPYSQLKNSTWNPTTAGKKTLSKNSLILKWPSAGDLIQGDKPDNACMCLFHGINGTM